MDDRQARGDDRSAMLDGTALLLGSAFLHASWNAVLKWEREPRVAVLGVLVAALTFAAAAALAVGGAFPRGDALLATVGAGGFEGLYFVTLAAALERASYGAVYAIARGGALVVVWPAATLLFHEPAGVRPLAGAALVGLGVCLVAMGRRERASRAGIAWATLCAACIGGYHLCYDRALAAGAAPAPVFSLALAVALPIVWASVWMLRGRVRPHPRAALRWIFAGALCTASFLLFLAGLARSGAGPALTLRNTAVVFAQVLAAGMGEALPRRQLAGSALVVAGTALLAWASP